MKMHLASVAAFAVLAVAVLAHGEAWALKATDLSTLTSRSYRKGWDTKIRIYKDLAYSTRADLADEGSGFVYVNGETNGTHRSGTYYDAYVKDSLVTSVVERAKMPVFVFLHGGAWCQAYDKDVACRSLLERIANKGYFVLSMSYQLQEDVINDSGKTARANATFGHMLKDVDTMLAYLKVELPKLGMPTNMVAIGGESAGGHLALCYAFDQTAPRLTGMGDVGLPALSHPLPVSCVMSDVGPTDLTECNVIDQSWGIGAWFMPKLKGMKLLMGWLCGKDFSNMSKQDAAVYIKKWNPTSLVSSSSCPAILAYGCTSSTPTENSDDTMVAVSNFIGLTNALKRAGVSYKAKLYTNTGHGSVADAAKDWIANKLYDFKTNHFVVAATPVVENPVVEEPTPSYGEIDTSAFSKKVEVVFDGYSGTSSLADFPVLVRLSPNIPGFSYADFKKADGGDLRFASASGKLLPHEIDTWNPNGVSTVWVKVPSLSGKNTKIVACYGCENPPAVNPKDVWSNGYVGVWHLGESKVPMKESSGESVAFNEAKGEKLGLAQAGVVGGSVDFDGLGGGTGGLRAPDCDALDGFAACTFEMWTWQKGHDVSKQRFLLAKRVNYNSDISYNIYDGFESKASTNKVICGMSTDQCAGTSADVWASLPASAAPELGSWNMVAHVYDSAAGKAFAYLNGKGRTDAKCAKGKVRAGAGKLLLGNSGLGADYAFPGKIDEVRISNVARSADWIKATHDTVMNPGFATYSTSAGKLSGYAAWMNVKELVGKPAAAAKGIANAVRYAFDIDPAKGADEIGEPILKVVQDEDGNPAVKLRSLAEGRGDVALKVFATEDLGDWSKATLVPMDEVTPEGIWKPARMRKSGGVPSQMFFRYTISVE